ncbi:hypothetical protein D3C73_1253960 [compost metagenome]
MGIGRYFGIHPGQVQITGLVQQLAEDLATADDAQFAGALAFCNRFRLVQRGHRTHALERHLAAAGQHQVGPPRQHAADRFGGLAPHQDRLAQGQRLEVLEVVRQVPGHGIALADAAIAIQRNDHREFHLSGYNSLKIFIAALRPPRTVATAEQ